jgi:acyl carrier protein
VTPSEGAVCATDVIRQVLAEYGKLAVDVAMLEDDADLYVAGLSSHASVNVILALEETFEVELPDSLLRKSTFGSVESIRAVFESIGVTEGSSA